MFCIDHDDKIFIQQKLVLKVKAKMNENTCISSIKLNDFHLGTFTSISNKNKIVQQPVDDMIQNIFNCEKVRSATIYKHILM